LIYAEVKQGHAFFVWLKQLCFSHSKGDCTRPGRNWFYQAVLFYPNNPFANDVAGNRIGHKQKEVTWL